MEFERVDIKEYVKAGLESGALVPFKAKKTAIIHAVQGALGERVISWVENPDGTERIERDEVVTIDDKTNGLGWIATKVDANGEPIIDRNGHTNQWIIKDSVFRNTYELQESNLYQKKGEQEFVQIPNNIVFENKYGETMNVASGGFINITDFEKMYGVSERDFYDTYTIIDNQEKSLSM